MSASREALAEAIGIEADAVRCENCIFHSWVAAGLTTCWNWETIVLRDSFCSFFEEEEA